jgi:signal transduction histidine kinase
VDLGVILGDDARPESACGLMAGSADRRYGGAMRLAAFSRSSLVRLRERVSPWLLTLLLGSLSVYAIVAGDFFGTSPPAPKLVMAVEAALVTIPLRWRKEAPCAVLGVVVVGSAFGWAFARGSGGFAGVEAWLAWLIAFYSIGAYSERRRGLQVAAAAGLVVLAMAVADVSAGFQSVGDYVGTFGFLAAAWLLGNSAGILRARGRELEGRTARLEREREEKARLAVAEERARIARELHDVVAHAVSTMVIQAGGARQLVRSDPADAEQSLLAAERTGREALQEMRRLVGLLRERGERLALAPQPGMAELEQLIAQTRAAGLPVELSVEGTPRHLGPGIDLTAYRIVQEALTNTLKHAGQARARVTLRYGEQTLEIEVTDDGRGLEGTGANGHEPGHGLVGMRERVTLYGGALQTGPSGRGGYAVRARLPLDPASPT